MEIARVQVEEGFLDGLDLHLEPGLNVLIGPRGSGKTSIIELIRFCLGKPAYTKEFDKSSREHALSILGSGKVTLTLKTQNAAVFVSRSIDDPEPRMESPLVSQPIILSQNEIERVGLDPAGRLQLVDDFRNGSDESLAEESLLADVASVTAELQGLAGEVADIERQMEVMGDISVSLEAAEAEAESFASSIKSARDEQARLTAVGDELARISVAASVLERSAKTIEAWQQSLRRLGKPTLEEWPEAAGDPNDLADANVRLGRVLELLNELMNATDIVLETVSSASDGNHAARLLLEEEGRELRRRVNEVDAGAGAIAQRLAALRERLGQKSALGQLLESKRLQMKSLRISRGDLLDKLDSLREARFTSRNSVVIDLMLAVGPTISVEIERFGMHGAYADAIAAALRGSGLHHSILAPLLSRAVSPRELVEAAEDMNVEFLSRTTDLGEERARRVLDYLCRTGTPEILTAPLDDLVVLSLLDGGEYKPTEKLSTGQRCTVILPILLAHNNQVLVVDQPEDNLDNAFIVETVIDAIRSRSQSQTIFATHNPNIPVLGDAAKVALLQSDGIRGFVSVEGPLEAPQVVEAITSVMEGGREAFERRARFYLEGRK